MMDFVGVEAEFRRLKAQFEKGSLTEADFRAQLEELMVEDEQGRWWIIGSETGQWYVHDGEKWVRQEPPRAARGAPGLPADSQPQATMAIAAKPRVGSRLGRDTVSVLLIAAAWLVCFSGIGIALKENSHWIPWTWWAGAGGTGGLVTGLMLRRTNCPTPWKLVPVVTLGWAVAMAAGWQLIHAPWLVKGAALGFIGGLSTALALKWARPSRQWGQIALVILGWGAGWAIGGAVAWSLGVDPYALGLFSLALRYALCGAIGGAIGGWVMLWQVQRAAKGSP